MKNKEIEELLNNMSHSYEIHEEIIKKYNNADKISYPYRISLKQINLLLSYIQQLKKKADHYKHLYSEVKKQKDDGIKYIKEHIKYECDDAFNGMQFYSYHLYDFNKEDLLRMLGEIDENR